MLPSSSLVDSHGRVLRDLRVSLTDRCNFRCLYCLPETEAAQNFYRGHWANLPNSTPIVQQWVPRSHLLSFEEIERVVRLAVGLGIEKIRLTGGEPLLHPDLDRLIARASSQGVVCTMISNGYPLTREWIRRLNAAKLSLLQMSVDNMEPNEFSQKSWSQIRKKLDLLKEHATFGVNINAVLGSSNLEQTRQVVASVRALGFYMTVGLMHDDKGQILPGLLRDNLAATYEELQRTSNKTVFHRTGEGWERDMLQDGSAPFKCRAGGRYLYVDEFGKVNYCSQRRGEPGIDLLDYTGDDVDDSTSENCIAEAERLIGEVMAWRAANRPELVPKSKS